MMSTELFDLIFLQLLSSPTLHQSSFLILWWYLSRFKNLLPTFSYWNMYLSTFNFKFNVKFSFSWTSLDLSWDRCLQEAKIEWGKLCSEPSPGSLQCAGMVENVSHFEWMSLPNRLLLQFSLFLLSLLLSLILIGLDTLWSL